MRRPRNSRRGISIMAVLTAGLLFGVGLTAEAESTTRPTGGPSVAHRNGKAVAKARSVRPKSNSIGVHAIEPTLGVDPGGTLYYAAAGFEGPAGLSATQIMRSTDGGKTWDNASPRVLERNTMPVSLDPYIWVDDSIDGDNARIFTIDLTLACSYMSFSDDGGDSWITNPLACGRPVNDHQTLFSGPPVTSSPIGYPNVLYYCWNDVASSACTKSIDGGLTFAPTGAPAYGGYQPGNGNQGFGNVNGFCGGLHGHGAVGPEGTLYLPREYCGDPTVAISHDEGFTWDIVSVSDIASTSQPDGGAAHPSVVTDDAGNVFYSYIGAEDRLLRLSVSRDQGATWSKPVIAGVPGLAEANLPQVDAAGKGKVAIVYYGSTNSPFPTCGRECGGTEYQPTTWNGYVTITGNALAKNPLFYTGMINDPKDPLMRARCGPGRCWMAYDFIDVEIGPNGIAYGAFVDGCMDVCTAAETGARSGEYEGLLGRLVGGPRLD